MPLTIEGQILTAKEQRDNDQRFLNKFGQEKFNEKLEYEGVYAYRIADRVGHLKAVVLLEELDEDYFYSDNQILKEKYFGKRGHHKWFEFSFWSSQSNPDSSDGSNSKDVVDCGFPDVIVFDKPFPSEDYEQRLISVNVTYRTIPVYRLGELTEEEIRTMSGGILWKSYCWVDLSESLRYEK